MAEFSETVEHTREANKPWMDVKIKLKVTSNESFITYITFPHRVDNPLLFCFLDNLLVERGLSVCALDVG